MTEPIQKLMRARSAKSVLTINDSGMTMKIAKNLEMRKQHVS